MKERNKNLLLTPEWPTHFPERCEKCENRYDPILSLELGPGRLGRFMKFIALWLPLAAIPIFLPARIRPLHFLTAVFLPSLIVFIFGNLLPKKTRLHCHNCGKTEYYNPPDSWDYRLANNSGTPAHPLPESETY